MSVYVGESTLIFTGGTIATGGASAGDLAAEIAARQAADNALGKNIGKIFQSRQAAVDVGQANLPFHFNQIVTLETGAQGGVQIVVRGVNASVEDPLFPTSPYWGVTTRIDITASLVSGNVLRLTNIGGTGDAITADLPAGTLSSVANGQWYAFSPTAENTAPDPTISVAGLTRNLRDFGGGILPAGFLKVGRTYIYRYLGSVAHLVASPYAWQDLQDLIAPVESDIVGLQNLLTDTRTRAVGTTEELQTVTGEVASGPSSVNIASAELFPAGGVLNRVEVHANAAATLRLRTWTKNGTAFTLHSEADVSLVAGYNLIENIGLDVPANGVAGFSNGDFLNVLDAVEWPSYRGGTLAGPNFNNGGTFVNRQLVKMHVDALVPKVDVDLRGYVDDHVVSVRASSIGADTIVEVETSGISGNGGTYSRTGPHAVSAAGTSRYDYVVLDRVEGELQVISGEEREREWEEFQPSPSHNQTPVARVLVNEATVVSVEPIGPVEFGVPAYLRESIDSQIDAIRRGCPRFMSKVRSGAPVRIGAIGDSITNIRGSSLGLETQVNGVERDAGTVDSSSYFATSGGYSPGFIASIPTYTAVQLGRPDDGGGQIHTRIGIIWGLVAALERQGRVLGTDLFYDNAGIGARASWHTWDLGTNSPTPWAVMFGANGQDLSLIAFGMNERGNPLTADRLIGLGQYLKDQGQEVAFVEVPRPQMGSVSEWRFTNAAIRRAAAYLGTGAVPLSAIGEAAYWGHLGVNGQDICSINLNNHPGVLELNAYGKLAGRIVEGF